MKKYKRYTEKSPVIPTTMTLEFYVKGSVVFVEYNGKLYSFENFAKLNISKAIFNIIYNQSVFKHDFKSTDQLLAFWNF